MTATCLSGGANPDGLTGGVEARGRGRVLHQQPAPTLRAWTAGVLFLILVLGSPASAFHMSTHVWISQEVLNDLLDDGTLTIEPFGAFSVRAEVLDALRIHDRAYRMGNIGPDGFPDIAAGQLTAHVDADGGWMADDWLRQVLEGAETPRQLAFALGYLSHAASDIFAHTYVNTYAGGVFDLGDGPDEVELRHVALEEYIVQMQPPLRDSSGRLLLAHQQVEVPARFVAERLILDQAVAGQYGRNVFYLERMYEYWNALDTRVGVLERAHEEMGKGIRTIRDAIDSALAHIRALKQKTVRICIPWTSNCWDVSVWPTYCVFDPATCIGVALTELSLVALRESLDLAVGLQGLVLTSGLNPLVRWRDEVEEAIVEYVRASGEVAKEILKGTAGDPFRPLREWTCRHGPAFLAVPGTESSPLCDFMTALDSLESFVTKIMELQLALADALGYFGWIAAPHAMIMQVEDNLTNWLREEFRPLAATLVIEVAGEDSLIADILTLTESTASPAEAAAELTSIFRFDSSSTGLLEIPDIVQRVRADMQVTSSGHFDPERFPPVRDAVVFSKLVLLEANELNRIVRLAGVGETLYGNSLYHPGRGFNVLRGVARSLDGSHQWQKLSLPFPRRPGFTDAGWPEERRFGVGAFRLWEDCEVREKVFKQIFQGPLAPALQAPETVGLPDTPLDDEDPNRVYPGEPFPLSEGSDLRTKIVTRHHTVEMDPPTTPQDLYVRVGMPTCGEGTLPHQGSFTRYVWHFVEECQYRCEVTGFRDGEAILTCTGPRCGAGGDVETFTVRGDEADLRAEIAKRGEVISVRQTSPRVYVVTVGSFMGTRLGDGSLAVEWRGNLICNPYDFVARCVKVTPGDLNLRLVVEALDSHPWRREPGGQLPEVNIVAKETYDLTLRGGHIETITDWRQVNGYLVSHTGRGVCSHPARAYKVRGIRDERSPVLIPPDDITVECAGPGGTTVELGTPFVTDDWDAEVPVSNDAPERFELGTTLVTWRAVDRMGNFFQEKQRVSVVDTDPPVFTDEPGELRILQQGGGLVQVELEPPPATDGCSGGVIATLEPPQDTFVLGATEVVWVARDGSGNETRISQRIVVEALRGDIDLDTDVDGEDVELVRSAIGSGPLGLDVELELEDFDGDGDVDVDDEAALGEVRALIASGTPDPRDLDQDGEITEADVQAVIARCAVPGCGSKEGGRMYPGDCSRDGTIDISDAVCLLGFLFLDSPRDLPCGNGRSDDPSNRRLADFNGDGHVDLSDAVSVLNFLFLGGPPHVLGSECVAIEGCPSTCGE